MCKTSRNIPEIKRIRNIILVALLLIAGTFVIPVKITRYSIDSLNPATDPPCFLVRQISSGSTEAGLWLCIGDAGGFWEDHAYIVELRGNTPTSVLSSDVYSTGETKFIIYGTLANAELSADHVNMIHCDKWDFLGDISRDPESLRLPFRHYITIYDLKLFENILEYLKITEISTEFSPLWKNCKILDNVSQTCYTGVCKLF